MHTLSFSLRISVALLSVSVASSMAGPLTWLKDDQTYLRSAKQTDFWTVSSYFIGQHNPRACGVACATIITNSVLSRRSAHRCRGLITHSDVTESDPAFAAAVSETGDGMDLDTYGVHFGKFLEMRTQGTYTAEVLRFDQGDLAENRKKLIELLARNEKSPDDFIIGNYLQGMATEDPEGMTGHYSPIGAFDAARERVLILDTDRDFYAPYWIDVDTFIAAMNTVDETVGKTRGLVYVSPRARDLARD